jgi:hypothetical protein
MQTSYTDTQPNGRAGLVVERRRDSAFIQGESSAEVAFGRFVCFKPAVTQDGLSPLATLPAAITAKLAGAVQFTHVYNPETALGTVGVKPGEVLKVLEAGTLWVEVETTVAVNDPVFVRAVVNGGANKLGIVRNAVDGVTTIELFGARFRTAASSGGIAIVEFDIITHLAGVRAAALPAA